VPAGAVRQSGIVRSRNAGACRFSDHLKPDDTPRWHDEERMKKGRSSEERIVEFRRETDLLSVTVLAKKY
jgi:hypothetical protein